MRQRRLVASATLLLASSCTITQTANPVIGLRDSSVQICVIEKLDVRPVFRDELVRAIQEHGFSVRILPPDAPVEACSLSMTYDAKWSWDFVPYMAWAEITVYRDGQRAGEALYSAPRGGWSLTFRIYESTASKVDTMVDQLFPKS